MESDVVQKTVNELSKTTPSCKLQPTSLRIRMKKCGTCGGYFVAEDLDLHETDCLNEDYFTNSNPNEQNRFPDIKNSSTSVVFVSVLILLLSIVVLQVLLFKQPIKKHLYETGATQVCTHYPDHCTYARFSKFYKSLSSTTINNPYVLQYLDWHGKPASAMVANGQLFFCEDLLCDISRKSGAIYGTWERRLEYLNWRREKRKLFTMDVSSLVIYHLDWNGNRQVSEVVWDKGSENSNSKNNFL